MSDVIQGSIGVILTFSITDETGAALDLTNATTTQLVFKPPGRSGPIVKTASVVAPATGGQLRYTTVAGDLYVPGTWTVQARAAFSGAGTDWYSTTTTMTVGASL